MNFQDLAELEKKATPGPWRYEWYYEEGDRCRAIETSAKLDAQSVPHGNGQVLGLQFPACRRAG
jgi:hypothetical protein